MRLIITGAGGFVGRHVLARLTEHEVVALDLNLEHITDTSNITKIEGDLRDMSVLDAAFQQSCDAVIHLATVPGGAAEINPDLAKSVNIDATMALVNKAANQGNCPRFIFASSIAVFGKLPNNLVTDEVPTKPTMLYGTHKLMMENWISTQTRRGNITGLSLRLPGIVARPKSPSGMKSAFLSDLFHALLGGENYKMPVSQNTNSWICSASVAAKNIALAASSEIIYPTDHHTILSPTLSVSMSDLAQEIRRQLGTSNSVISYSPDKAIQSIFGGHPNVKTPKAHDIGLIGDANLKSLVRSAIKDCLILEKTNA